MQQRSLKDVLAEIADSEPRPRIDVGLSDRNRISLDHWSLEQDCIVGHAPGGSPRFVIPLSQIVIIEWHR